MENRPKLRVLVDWDNDGFFNVGVPASAPINLLPYPAYCANLFPKNQPSSGVLEDAEYEENFSELGLLVMSFDITGGFPSYFGVNIDSTSDNYLVTNASYILKANIDYRLAFYVFGSHNLDIKVYRGDLGATTETLIDSVTNVNVTGGWTRVDFEIPDDADTTNFFVTLERNGGGNTTFSVRGVLLVEGTTIGMFNCGELSSYDNIADYVLTASWELGRNNYDDPIAYEGTARIILNNQSKIFSPAYTSSPLYGNLNQNLMIAIEYEYGINNWVRMWTGWTSQFKAIAGLASTLQAEIVCQQGIYRLRDGDLDFDLTENMSINDAIIKILNNAGFRSAYYPLITSLNFDARLGWNSWLQDAEELFSHISTAYRYMELVGFGWSRKTSPSEAIEQMLKAEHSKLWIDREGGLVLKHREDFVNNTPDYAMNLGSDVQEATYRFGEDIVNQVSVFVKPRKEVTNEVIWNTKEPIVIIGHPFGDGNQTRYTKYIEMHFEFEEGGQRTISQIDGASIRDMNVTVYNRNPRLYVDPSPYEVPSSEWDGQVHATILGHESLRKKLQVRNNLEYQVWIDIEVTGSYFEGGEGGLYVVDDLESQALIRSVQSEKIELPSATTEIEATSYANFVLHRKSTPIGEFTDILIRNNPTLTIGDILDLSETQTGEVSRKHVIIGEKGDYSSGMLLDMNYKIARLDEQTYFAVDDETSYGTPNVIPNLLEQIIPVNNAFEKIKLLTPEGESAYAFGGYGAAMIVIGNHDGNHVINWYSHDTATSSGDWTNHNRTEFYNGARVGIIGIGVVNPEMDEDAPISFIIDTYLLEAGTYLMRLLLLTTINSINFNLQLDDSPTSITKVIGTTPAIYTHETVATGIGGINGFMTRNGGVNVTVYWGDISYLHYPTLATTDLDLEAGITHYFSIWALVETPITHRIIILAEDGTELYDDYIDMTVGFNRYNVSFVPVSGKEHAHAIIMYPTVEASPEIAVTDYTYIYGLAVTTQLYDTYKETNEIQQNLPVLYI